MASHRSLCFCFFDSLEQPPGFHITTKISFSLHSSLAFIGYLSKRRIFSDKTQKLYFSLRIILGSMKWCTVNRYGTELLESPARVITGNQQTDKFLIHKLFWKRKLFAEEWNCSCQVNKKKWKTCLSFLFRSKPMSPTLSWYFHKVVCFGYQFSYSDVENQRFSTLRTVVSPTLLARLKTREKRETGNHCSQGNWFLI